MEEHQSDKGKRIFDSKRTYFDNEHTFLLAGHGAEVIRPGLRDRFELNEGEYCAISNSVNENGIVHPHYITDFLKKRANKIKIPYNDTIINDPKLGFIDSVGKRNELDPEQKYVDIDYFKLYRPRIDDTNNRVYKYTVPNLIFAPARLYDNNIDFYKNLGMNNITYKGVNYTNKNIDCIGLRPSGIISRITREYDINFKLSKIFKNHDDFNKNLLDLRYYEIPKNNNKAFFFSFDKNNSDLLLSVPSKAWYKPIKDIIADKDTDPLSFDFLQMLIDSFKNSILTFDDVCLLARCKDEAIYYIKNEKPKTPIFTKFAKHLYKIFGREWETKTFKEKKLIYLDDISDYFFLDYIKRDIYFIKSNKELIEDVTIGDIQSAHMKLETVFKYLKLKINYNKSNPIIAITAMCRGLDINFPSSEKTIRRHRALSRPAATKKKTATIKSKTLKQSKAKSH